MKISNKNSQKQIQHKFTCEHKSSYQSTICNFVIAVHGKENHGTHYDIAIHRKDLHRLLTPGHTFTQDMNPNEKIFLKFSNPKMNNLYLNIESIWGNFNFYMDKRNEFPDETSEYSTSFISSN